MIGAMVENETFVYAESAVAATYGPTVERETTNSDDAYADWPPEREPRRAPWPPH